MSTQDGSRRGARSAVPFLLLAVLTVASGLAAWLSYGATGSRIGPEGVMVYNVPDLAPATTTVPGHTVDGITCQTASKEVVKYHIHVYVSVYVNGAPVRLPAGIGLTQPPLVQKSAAGTFLDVGLYDCLYWLHTHVADGIIHVEAPSKQAFTLGQFFDIWNQPLSSTQVGPDQGTVVVFQNGKEVSGDPRMTPLLAHSVIQLDVGTPVVPFHRVTYKVVGACGQGTNSCSPATS